jgi:hypothetical protein
MTVHSIPLWSEIIGVGVGALVLLVFGILLVIPHNMGILPGSKGHRKEEDEEEHEQIAPDGFIDSFANVIEEAGGSLPILVRIAIPGIIIWWLLYLILNWAPK